MYAGMLAPFLPVVTLCTHETVEGVYTPSSLTLMADTDGTRSTTTELLPCFSLFTMRYTVRVYSLSCVAFTVIGIRMFSTADCAISVTVTVVPETLDFTPDTVPTARLVMVSSLLP